MRYTVQTVKFMGVLENNRYEYVTSDNNHVTIETSRYGVAGLDIFVTIDELDIHHADSYIPFGHDNVIMCKEVKLDGKRFGIKPPLWLMDRLIDEKNSAKKNGAIRKTKGDLECAYDNAFNDGREGFNPYREEGPDQTFHDLEYKGDEILD